MTWDNRLTKVATKVLDVLRLSFLIVIFPLDAGLIWGEVGFNGLCMVRDRRSKDFFCKRNSSSLSTEFVGDVIGVEGEEGFGFKEAYFEGVVWDDDMART